MTDTISIHQSFLMPATKGVKAAPVDVDGYAVVNNDSLNNVLDGIKDVLEEHNQSLDSLTTKVNGISELGVGYSDALSHIAIPLIIALFAFAFTYLFSVITRINEKYNSESISRMFKTSLSYRCYMWGSGISVGYVILMGALSLMLTDTVRQGFIPIMSWSCLVVAGLYSSIILWFVHTCLEYDDHQKMLGIIESRYQWEKKKSSALNHRTERLIDLCRYADSKHNADLVATVLNRVIELDKAERNDKKSSIGFYTMRFYESMVESYILNPHDGETERNLLWNWSRTFRHDKLPITAIFYRMLGKMVEAVKRGRFSLFEAFMENCKFRYDYINHVPEVRFSVGENVEEQKKVDEEGLEMWRELRNVHYIAAAYLFSIGHYEVAGVLKKGAGSNNNSFFPTTAAQILMQYANCKENQDSNSGSFFRAYMSIDKVIGHKYDRELLEKFTAMLLLLSVEPDEEEEYVVCDSKRKLIDKAKEELIKYGGLWVKHPEIVNRYPSIQGKKIKKLIELAMKKFTNGELQSEKPQKGRRTKEPVQTIFDLQLTIEDEKPVRELFDTILYSNRGSITDGLNGDFSETKNEEIEIGAYTFLTSKQIVLNQDIWHHPQVFNDMLQVFKTRFIYVVYEALSQMKVKEVYAKWDEFEKLFAKEVGEQGEQYVMIDTESSIDGYIKMDPLPDGKKWSMHRYYKGAYYYNSGFGSMFKLRDVPLAEKYGNTVVLVRFTDLPVLVNTSKDGKPIVQITDEPNREKGWASMRVIVDPCLVAKYSKDAEVVKFNFRK